MARAAGVLLMVLASASIALGSPLCCLVGTPCCGTQATVDAQDGDCCPHCKREQPEKPAPKPSDKKDCMCKHDVASHAASADHVPLVAVFDLPAAPLMERAAVETLPSPARALPASPASRSHPLLL